MTARDEVRESAPDWTEPAAEEVAPGVHRIPLPLPSDGLRAVNAYLLADADGPVLVDPGWAVEQAREELEHQLVGLGIGLGDVARIFVTHIHRDHYTQAIRLRREFGARVWLGLGEEPAVRYLTSPGASGIGPSLAELRQCGAGRLADLLEDHPPVEDSGMEEDVETPDDWLDAGEIRLADRVLRVIPTPGHTRGHVVFFDVAAGLMFTGDHLLPHITPSVGFEPVPDRGSLGAFLSSLELLRTLPDARLLPAHGPVAASTHRRAGELLAHHDSRLAETLAAVAEAGSKGLTPYETAQLLPWTRRRRRFDDLDPFNRMLAVLETRRHLDLLLTRGSLRARSADGVQTFLAVAGGDGGGR